MTEVYHPAVTVTYPQQGYIRSALQGPASVLIDRRVATSEFQNAVTQLTEELHARSFEQCQAPLLAFDIDGTILDENNQISTGLVRALRELAKTDAHVVIATGRTIPELLPVITALAIPDLWVVCSNGAVTLHARWDGTAVEYRIHRLVCFDASIPARAVIQALPNVIIAAELIGRGYLVTSIFPQGEIIGEQIISSVDQILAEPVPKLVARIPGMDRDEFEAAIEQIGLTDVQWCVGWGAWMDAAPPGTSKATGLTALCKDLVVPATNVIAVGDSTNDIDMFRWAGLAVGIGSGNKRALEVADIVTNGVKEDGALAVITALTQL